LGGIDNQEEADEKTNKIAKALASGKAGTTIEELKKYMTTIGMSGDAMEAWAKQVWNDRDDLRKYGESLNATEA
jgi:hypothetical protein